MTDILKNLIFILGIVFTGAAGYLLLVESETSTLNRTLDAASEQMRLQRETAEFVSRLNTLQQTNISTTFVEDPRFTVLKNNEVSRRQVMQGRVNPFQRIYETGTNDFESGF